VTLTLTFDIKIASSITHVSEIDLSDFQQTESMSLRMDRQIFGTICIPAVEMQLIM